MIIDDYVFLSYEGYNGMTDQGYPFLGRCFYYDFLEMGIVMMIV